MTRMAAWCVVLLGCQPVPDTPDAERRVPACEVAGESEVLVLRQISFPREVDGVSVGFDLDQAVTQTGDPNGCGVEDYVSPEGVVGIDNAFARLRPALDTTEAVALDQIVLAAINSGGLLAMVELHDVSDPYNDACVDLRVTSGDGAPMIGSDGLLLPSQTFGLDLQAPVSEVHGAQIVDGVLEDGPIDLRLPFQFLDADVVFTLLNARIRLEREPDGRILGRIGGGIAIQELSDLAHNTGIDQTVEELLDSLLGFTADLAPDNTGACQLISVTLEVEAVPAFYFSE